MTPLEALAVAVAAFLAGAANTIIGAGSLITFPTLLAVGYDPLTANVSNTVGLVAGSISGATAQREELVGQRARLLRLTPLSALGGLTGALLLMALPAEVFDTVVPPLLVLGSLLVLLQPRLRAWLGAGMEGAAGGRGRGVALGIGVYLTGVYGGYFGAAQGVILLGLLGLLVQDTLQRLNATKNVLAAIVNGVAAVALVIGAAVAWPAVGVITLAGIAGGQVGARVARRVPERAFRIVVAIVGLAAAARLQFG
jgi:uncharacterized membrane protein YfcA